MIEYVADSTHEAHMALMLHDARVALLVFANPVQRRPDSAVPFGCAPEPELAPFVDVGLPFFAVGNEDEFPLEMTTNRSRTASQSYPRAR